MDQLEQLGYIMFGAVVSGIVGYGVAWVTRSVERRDRRRVAKDRIEISAARVALVNQWLAASERLGGRYRSDEELAAARRELSAAFSDARTAIGHLSEAPAADGAAERGSGDTAARPATAAGKLPSIGAQLRRFLLLERRRRLASYAVVIGFYSTFVTGWIIGLSVESGNSIWQRAAVALFWTVIGFPVVGVIVRRIERIDEVDEANDASHRPWKTPDADAMQGTSDEADDRDEFASWNPPSSVDDP